MCGKQKNRKKEKNQTDTGLVQHCQMRKMSSIMSINRSSTSKARPCSTIEDIPQLFFSFFLPSLSLSTPTSFLNHYRSNTHRCRRGFLLSLAFVITPPTVHTSRLFHLTCAKQIRKNGIVEISCRFIQ